MRYGAAFAILALCACGETDKVLGLGPAYHADVAPLIEARCAACHRNDGVAPFPLTTYAEVYRVRDLVKRAVRDRRMPPWAPAKDCASYADDVSLSQEQIATFVDWADRGAREGPRVKAAPVPRRSGLARVDLTLESASYTPKPRSGTEDDFRCFALPWPYKTKRYITGYALAGSGGRLLHHANIEIAAPKDAAWFKKAAARDAAPGWDCTEDANPIDAVIGAYVPGDLGSEFSDGTGLPVAAGSTLVLLAHFSTAAAKPRPVTLALSLRVADSARHAAANLVIDERWLERGGMPIPAGRADVKHGFAYDVSRELFAGANAMLHQVGVHMHLLGKRGLVQLWRKNGSKECLLDLPRWDFAWQRFYRLAKPRRLSAGDRVYVECHWDNSAANQPIVAGKRQSPRYVEWGEGTRDEMCGTIVYAARADAQ